MNTTYRMLLVLAVVLAWFAPVAHAKWYDPQTGRWLERDPLRYADGMNKYQYVESNPIRLVDPTGMLGEQPPESQPVDQEKTDDGKAVGGQGGPSKPCLDKSGKPIELNFDGDKLNGPDGCSCGAASGTPDVKLKDVKGTSAGEGGVSLSGTEERTFDYSKERQKMRDQGPIPEGGYWISSCHEDSADGKNNPKGEGSSRHKWWSPRQSHWGDYSWPITALPGTNTNDTTGKPRSNFFVHGGVSFGSAGCIDIAGSDGNFHNFMDGVRASNSGCCYIKINVKYPNQTVTKTGPYHGP